MKNFFFQLAALSFVATALCLSAFGQQAPANQFELASHARAKARVLAAAKNYEGAIAVLDSLELGKYEIGDAAMQASAAKNQGVQTDKGRNLINLGRYDQADATFYKAFDANIVKANEEFKMMNKYVARGSARSVDVTLANASRVSGEGSLTLADAVVTLRSASYSLAGASARAKPFDPARLTGFAALKDSFAKAAKL